MEDSSDEQAAKSAEKIQDIHKRIKRIKSSEKVGVRYMQAWEERIFDREDARREGREEGIKEGIQIFILDNMEENIPKERILDKLMRRFELSLEEAQLQYEEAAKINSL